MCCCEGEAGCCGKSCKYKGPCIRNLGWALIVLAVIGAILAVVADGVYAGYPFAIVHHISAPIWGGAFIIVAAGLAVCGGNNPDNACLRISLLVMSIFGIMFAVVIWIIAAIGIGSDGNQCDWFMLGPCDPDEPYWSSYNCGWWSDYWYDLYPNWRSIDCSGIKALHALQLILGLAETVLMFIVSIRTCCGTCRNCCKGTQQPPTHAIIYQPGQPLPQQYLGHLQDSSQPTTPSTAWVVPSSAWVIPRTGWVVPCTGWDIPRTGWDISHTSWGISHTSWGISHTSWGISHTSWGISHTSWGISHTGWGISHTGWAPTHCIRATTL
ncbi:hypothetical protein Bbelb_196800 [Branchiostoma belcheri]|nr:hypothetical protein Bbelb_196800 [Branchiostoma belcheri]